MNTNELRKWAEENSIENKTLDGFWSNFHSYKNEQEKADGIYQDVNGAIFQDDKLSEEITEVYILDNGEMIEISLEEYVSLLQETGFVEEVEEVEEIEELNLGDGIEEDFSPMHLGGYSYSFTESSNNPKYISKGRISQILQNACYAQKCGDLTENWQYSTTQGHSYSVSLTSNEKSTVKAGVTYSWQYTASVTKSRSLTILPGNEGW